MNKSVSVAAFAVMSLLAVSVAAAQTNPTLFLSSSYVSFFNGDQDSVDATITNNDGAAHIFTISVFPASLGSVFADTVPNHVSLQPGESVSVKITLSSLFDADFLSRNFAVTVAATDDPSISSTKNVVVNVLRRSPVFVLALTSDKLNYQPGDTINVSSVVANKGGDSTDQFTMQTVISSNGQPLKRFETPITYLPQKSTNTFSNLYTLDQFAAPGAYDAQLVLKDATGQTLSIKSTTFKVGEVDRASQQESSSVGVLESSTTVTSKNEGNSPSDIVVTATIPSMAKEIFDSDVKPDSMVDDGSSTKVTWTFQKVAPGSTVSVVYKFVLWKVWGSIMIVIFVVYMAFKFVFTVRIIKRSAFVGPLGKESEVPVTIEIVNRSIHEVKDVVVKDFVPPIAKVVPRFDTVKPALRETVGGTELVWKFDSLRAGEERIMSYRIKPKMDILGSLKLNPANMGYSNRKREKRSAASSIIVVKQD